LGSFGWCGPPSPSLLWIAACSAALAEKRITLLIGNKDYKAGVGSLVNPLNDIRVVGDALKAVGFELLKPTQNATRTGILLAVPSSPCDTTRTRDAVTPLEIRKLMTAGTGYAERRIATYEDISCWSQNRRVQTVLER
jgi:hypothetical protein